MVQIKEVKSIRITTLPWRVKSKDGKGTNSELDVSYASKSVTEIDTTAAAHGEINITTKFSAHGDVNSEISYTERPEICLGRGPVTTISLGSAFNYRNYENKRRLVEINSKSVNKNVYTSIRKSSIYSNSLYPLKIYDNGYVAHAIPATPYGFKWISDNSLPDYFNSGPNIEYPQGEVYDYKNNKGNFVNFLSSSYDNNKLGDYELDTVGTNTSFYDPISLISLTSGEESTSFGTVSASEYNKYLSNKKHVIQRSKAYPLWSKERSSIIQQLNRRNLITATIGKDRKTSFYRISPVSINNVSKVAFSSGADNYRVEARLSSVMENQELSTLFTTRTETLNHAKQSYEALKNAVTSSGYQTKYSDTTETVFPKRENTGLSFSMKRAKYQDSLFEKMKRTSSLRTFWHSKTDNRVRPHGSSNALDYKNSPYYNTEFNQVDSIFPLDNTTTTDGKKLLGELSYQGNSFYDNLIMREKGSSLRSQTSPEIPTISALETVDSARVPILSSRPLEILNAKKSLIIGADISENYQWGTSINPIDLNKNFMYYTGTFYDRQKFSIDFKNQPDSVSYNNKVVTLSSYPKTNHVLGSYGISREDDLLADGNDTFSLYTDGDIPVSSENTKVKVVNEKMSINGSVGLNNNLVYKSSSRPTMQLFYQSKEFYGKESGFSFDETKSSPFYDSWYDFEKTQAFNGNFNSLVSEFNMSRNFDIYESSENKLNTNNKAFLSLPGSGETTDRTSTNDSRRIRVSTSKKYSFDGMGIRKVLEYPQSDNNDAWFSTRNRDGKLHENKDYRGKNIASIPSDSTFSLDNSSNTLYDITKTNGYDGLNSSKRSWFSVEPKIKKNAAAEFNVKDFSNDYLEFKIDKFGSAENIRLGLDFFAVSLWYQPQEDWFNAEDEIGLFSLVNEQGDFSHYLSVYAKGPSGGVTVRDSFVGQVATHPATHSPHQANNIVLVCYEGLLSVYLNSVKILDEITWSNAHIMSLINKILLGVSKDGTSVSKYRGAIDEFYLFSGTPTQDDIDAIYSGGKPSNLMEFKANDEISSQLIPVIYNRIGYPYSEDIEDLKEEHSLRFLKRYVLGDATDASVLSFSKENQKNRTTLSGVNKLLPYNGLYPYQRVMQIGESFLKTYKVGTLFEADKNLSYSQSIQSLLQPFFAPGVIFNSLRAGIECPWPIYTNATGQEPTFSYNSVVTYEKEFDDFPVNKICDNIVPSWYLGENKEHKEFLKKYPETLEEVKKTRSYRELVKNQPKFLKGFNKAGLVINSVTNSKVSVQSLRDESFYESFKKAEQKNLKRVKAYQYCVLEFSPEDIEDKAGFSLFVPGKGENLNITFTKSDNIEKTAEKYSINRTVGSYDAQIEIQAYDFNVANIEKSVCSLLNTHMTEGEYRAISLNREDETISNPEMQVMRSVDLTEIDERLDTSGSDRVRLALVYVGTDVGSGIENRSFLKASKASVSTYSGKLNQSLGIFYRDRYNSPERDLDLQRAPYGQYDKSLYSGKEIVISTLSGQTIASSGAEKKPQQIYFLAGDHYTGNVLELKDRYVWPSFTWKKTSPDKSFTKSLNNFVEQSQNFFLKNRRPLAYHASNQDVVTIPGKTYTMEVYMRKTDNFSTTRTIKDNDGKFYGSPYRFQDPTMYRSEEEITDDLAFAPFAPAYHYGETVAKISFVAKDKITNITDIAKSSTITYLNPGMEKEYRNRFPQNGSVGYESFKESPSYKGKNNLDSCVSFRKVIDGSWEISLMTEFPILNYYDNNPTITRPRGFLYDYGMLPTKGEGVYFGIRESIYQEPGSEEDSLIELCGFQDSQDLMPVRHKKENRVGEIAEQRIVKEAVIAIPYNVKEYNKLSEDYALTGEKFIINQENKDTVINFFRIDEDVYQKVLAGELKSESISKMIHRLEDYILPPELDFVNDESKSPFVCYVLETEIKFNQQELADIWQGRLPNSAKVASVVGKDESNLLEHSVGKDEFFHGRKIPEGTNFMVFKVKQKTSSYDRTEVIYNWPNDYMSILEKASVKFETTEEVT